MTKRLKFSQRQKVSRRPEGLNTLYWVGQFNFNLRTNALKNVRNRRGGGRRIKAVKAGLITLESSAIQVLSLVNFSPNLE